MSDLFIRRPVMTVLMLVSILSFGLIGYRQPAVSDLPNVKSGPIEFSTGC